MGAEQEIAPHEEPLIEVQPSLNSKRRIKCTNLQF
jgi:hypothetical protein